VPPLQRLVGLFLSFVRDIGLRILFRYH
jgi:hypothetical protein